MLNKETPAAKDPHSVLSRSVGLTRRETDVLRFVGARYSNAEIAERLGISKRTVESHMAALFRKFEVPDRPALIRVVREAVPAPTRSDARERHRIRAAAAQARAEAEQRRVAAHGTIKRLHDTIAMQRTAMGEVDDALSPQHHSDGQQAAKSVPNGPAPAAAPEV